MTESDPHSDDWLSLAEASALLGVAESTLRRWGDSGKVPMKRTLGGHRRFARAALLQFDETQRQHASQAHPGPLAPLKFDARAMSRSDWHTRLMSRSDSDRMRGLGQRLLGLLIQYINRQEDDTRFLHEARTVGSSYGRETRLAGVSMHDTVEAFLFFRSSFSRLALPMPGMTQPKDLDQAAALHTRIDRFMDAVLLGAIDGYERQ